MTPTTDLLVYADDATKARELLEAQGALIVADRRGFTRDELEVATLTLENLPSPALAAEALRANGITAYRFATLRP